MSFSNIVQRIANMQTSEWCSENLQVQEQSSPDTSKAVNAFISLIEQNPREAMQEAAITAAAADKLKGQLLRKITPATGKQIIKITLLAESLKKGQNLTESKIAPGLVHQLIESNPPNLDELLRQLKEEGVDLSQYYKGENPLDVAFRLHNKQACLALVRLEAPLSMFQCGKAEKEGIEFLKLFLEALIKRETPLDWFKMFLEISSQNRKELLGYYFHKKRGFSEDESHLLLQKLNSLTFLQDSIRTGDIRILEYGDELCKTAQDWARYLDNLQGFGQKIQGKTGGEKRFFPNPELTVVLNMLDSFQIFKTDLNKHCEAMDRVAQTVISAENRKKNYKILGGAHHFFMHYLLIGGHFNDASFFLKAGARVEGVSSEVVAYCSSYPGGLTWLTDNGISMTTKSYEPVPHTLVRLLSEGAIEDHDALQRLAEAGFDLNQKNAVRRTPLQIAIEHKNKDRATIAALLKLNVEVTHEDLKDLPVVESLAKILRQRKIPYDVMQGLENIPLDDNAYKQEVYRFALKDTLQLSNQEADALQKRFFDVTSQIKYKATITRALHDLEHAVIRYGMTRFKTVQEWNAYLDRLASFSQKIKGKCHTALWGRMPNVQGITEEQKEASVVIQVLWHIFTNMNKELGERSDALEKISNLISAVPPQHFEKLFSVLQTSESLEDAAVAMEMLKSPEPAREEWNNLPSETILRWLAFYRVFRSRTGLARCHAILKNRAKDKSLLIAALKTIEVIGIPFQAKHSATKIVQLCLNLAKTSPSIDVKIQALKTLRIYDSNPNNAEVKAFMGQELSHIPRDKKYTIALLKLLENYTCNPDSSEDRKTASLLLELSQDPDREIRYQTALALSGEWKDKNGLLRAVEVIKSSDWQRHNQDHGKDQTLLQGHHLTIRARPVEIHDNRHAQLIRIQNRLVDMMWEDNAFQKQIQARYEAYKKDPKANPELERLQRDFEALPRNNSRYIPLPIFYPPNGIIMRGLAPRDGVEIWGESVRDLIRSGCWKSDLTTTPSPLDGTWCKIGHIFATHNEELIGQQYFPGKDSVLIVIAGDAYNQALLKNQARCEYETTLNTVFYQGVPRAQIQHWYIDKTYLPDLALLADEKSPPIADLVPLFTTPLFKKSSHQELSQFRRHLRAKDRVFCEGKWVEKSMFERCNPYNGPAAKEFAKDGLYRINNDAVLEETLKRAIGRQIVREQLDDPTFFLGQDEMLHVNDATFRAHLPQFLKMVPFEVSTESQQALLALTTDGLPNPAEMRRKILFEGNPKLAAFAEAIPLYFG